MAALFFLPNEILHEIIEELPLPSLSSFCRTCQATRVVAEPLLYRNISWEIGSAQFQTRLPIHAFFRTISHRPALALHVKSVVLHSGFQPKDWMTHFAYCSVPDDLSPLWLDALAQLDMPTKLQQRFFRSKAEVGDLGVLTGIVLASLPMVEELVIDTTLIEESDLLEMVIGGLLSLKNVTIHNNLDSRILGRHSTVTRLSSVFHLPRLEQLCTTFQFMKRPMVAGPKLSALRTLGLVDRLSYPSAIKTLLARAPKLESLSYFLVEDMDDLLCYIQDARHRDVENANSASLGRDRDSDDFNTWHTFARALKSVSGSLTTLTISLDAAGGKHDRTLQNLHYDLLGGVSARRGRIGSLQHLENLTSLEIPMLILFNDRTKETKLQDLLPPSLKKLTLRDDYINDHDLLNCTPSLVIPALESYLLEQDPFNPLSLYELCINLRIRDFHTSIRRNKLGLKGVHRFTHRHWGLERICKQAAVRCVLHVRRRSVLLPGRDCVDIMDETVVYDPSIADGNGGMKEEGRVRSIFDKLSQIKKRARGFHWSWGPVDPKYETDEELSDD